jgi:excisionase family DNA binding protein
MADRIAVPLPDGRWLAMEPATFVEALGAGAELLAAQAVPAAPAGSAEPLLDSEQLAEALRVPVTWIEQAARERRIPSLEFGRWRRFKRSEVEAAVRAQREGERA